MQARQILVNRRNHLSTIADGRRNPLDGPRADVANGENATLVRLMRKAVFAAGRDEPALVEFEARILEPVGVGLRDDEAEQVAGRAIDRLAG